jgi:galactosylceramidase
MDEACAQIDRDTWRGSHVALRNPETGDWSLIVCTGRRTRLKVSVGNNLKSEAAYLWRSTADEQFVQLSPAKLTGGTEIDLEPDAVYTLTSTTGQRKGTHDVPPRQQAFPIPFADSFERYRPGDTPRYFADQKGTFEIVSKPGGGQCLGQIVPAQGLLWFDTALLKPHTVFGDGNWRDSVVEVDVLIAGGEVEIGGRYAHRDYLGYRLILASDGQWQLNWQLKTLGSGMIVSFDSSGWHRLRLSMKGSNIDAVIDGVSVASVADASGTQGMAFLGSSYHFNLFDNVRVSLINSAHSI